ncbi:hypothetical protein [Vibrio panuliri]|uniref:Uncharacterized protein n=1 Tax=Vibrio panuliri TaxID=1381081 RepID=A0ABX3FJ49_9VIBR|nr:hypothetical protein [Vibrio panuliri]KAB1457407.1 hypothetical protein F7O85_06600 [Vibrio panuliri]OLQ91432.1 hypothetical protein BIY20_01080 [Vibrio panuliri]
MIQIDKNGRIKSINIKIDDDELTTLDIEPTKEILAQPFCYQWNGSEFIKLDIEPINDEQQNRELKAHRYLKETDFYVVRKIETGVAIPKEVMNNRNRAREVLIASLPSSDF